MGLEAKNPYEKDEFTSAETGEVAFLLTAIDHVGIAVTDIDEAIADYRDTFDVLVSDRELVDGEGVEVAVLEVGESSIQLITPTRDDSPVAAFLAERGPGLHHVGYRVTDCAAALAAAAAQGHRLVDEEPYVGIRGTSVAFLHPKALHGTLIQLVQVAVD